MQEYMSSWLSQAIQVRLRKDLWSAVEGFRRNEPDIPTRPEAVRRLLHRALDLAEGSNVADRNSDAAALIQQARPTISPT
jgi:hypothetical protein